MAFRPMFFNPPLPGANDLSLMCTLGWKGQAMLGDMDIGFVQKGGRRLMGSGGVAAADCVTDLWKN